jgi:hypothetical protein
LDFFMAIDQAPPVIIARFSLFCFGRVLREEVTSTSRNLRADLLF